MTEIHKNIERIRERVNRAEAQYSRTPGSVMVLAVSKKCGVQAIADAYRAGLTQFAESYLQEALPKISVLASQGAMTWHFIGPVQSNKTQGVAQHFDWVHSVDRLKIAQRLNDQRPEHLPPLNVCIQVNVSGEATKSGVAPATLGSLLDAISAMPRLALRGLMAIPARSKDFDQQCKPYHDLKSAFDDCRKAGYALDTLSMGMSDDLEAAISQGATIVRVGRGIFGERS